MTRSAHHVRSLLSALLALGALAASGCSDGKGPTDTEQPDVLPDPTPRGAPAGPPVTKTIGPQGGSVTSADGGLTLTVPAGAVAAATEFGIEPITNNLPGGLGQAYRLTPEGQTFAVPVRLVLRYTDGELQGGDPEGLGIAYQDGTGVWWALLATSVDTAAGTLSVSTTRLAQTPPSLSRATGTSLAARAAAGAGGAGSGIDVARRPFFLMIGPTSVKVKKSAQFEVKKCVQSESGRPSENGSGDDELPALPPAECQSVGGSGQWSVEGRRGGNGTVGTITPQTPSSVATYTAPAKVPTPRSIRITADMTWQSTTRRGRSKVISTFSKKVSTVVSVEEDCSGLRRASFALALAAARDDVCEVIPLHVVATYNRPDQPVLGGYAEIPVTDGFEADVDVYPVVVEDRLGTVARIKNTFSTMGNLRRRPDLDQICDVKLTDVVEQFTADSGAVTPGLEPGSATVFFYGRYKDPAGTVSAINVGTGACEQFLTYPGAQGATGFFFSLKPGDFVQSGDKRTYTVENIKWTFVVTRR